ncbi:MAG: glycosyltransferase [Anaerolineales bacterium]|nr:glycosyltransferase [Anaerolineales bacterium]
MRFSVVIPTFNRQATLRQTLAALVSQDYSDAEIIVVDDGSTDGTGDMIAREFPTVRYLRQANRGPAAARNFGIREPTGDIVAFTDDDCVPPRDWLTRLADGYARYSHVVGVGGYLQAPDEVLKQSPIARYENYVAHMVYHVSECEHVAGFQCAAGGTNNMSYRRAVLREVGGFDESFRYAAGEDADLKWRICARGHQLLYVPVRMTHLQEYNWARFRRQCFFRGKGRTQFEIRRGRKPNAFILLGRFTLAVLHLPVGLVTMPEPTFAIARLVEHVWGAWGQWNELKRCSQQSIV